MSSFSLPAVLEFVNGDADPDKKQAERDRASAAVNEKT